MTYRLVLSGHARRDIAEFLEWLQEFDPRVEAAFARDLDRAIREHVLQRPHTWPFFFLTGSPYRAYLFTVSRRTNYWVIYTIDESKRTVKVLRFWSSSRDPDKFVV